MTAVQGEIKPPVARTADSIRKWITEWMGKELAIDGASIKPGKPFFDYGLASVLAAKLSRELSAWLGQSLNATTTWNLSTIESLTDYLVNLSKTPSPSAVSPSGIKPEIATQTHPVEAKSTEVVLDTKELSDSELAELLNKEVKKSREGRQI